MEYGGYFCCLTKLRLLKSREYCIVEWNNLAHLNQLFLIQELQGILCFEMLLFRTEVFKMVVRFCSRLTLHSNIIMLPLLGHPVFTILLSPTPNLHVEMSHLGIQPNFKRCKYSEFMLFQPYYYLTNCVVDRKEWKEFL